MVGLCESNSRKVFLGLNEIPSPHMKIDNLFILSRSIFYIWFTYLSIFNVEKATTIYQNDRIFMRNSQKLTVLL